VFFGIGGGPRSSEYNVPDGGGNPTKTCDDKERAGRGPVRYRRNEESDES
jgi:hypothetical protein